MLIYIFILLLSLILLMISNKKLSFSFLIIFSMFLVCALRGRDIGIDTNGYVKSFEYGVEDYFSNSSEFFFTLTYSFVHLFSDSWTVWLCFVSVLIYIPIFFVISKGSYYPVLSAVIFMVSTSFFFPESMNIIRQSIAASFLLCSYYFCSDKRYIPTFLFFICAVLFHTSSVIALPFFFLLNIRIHRNIVIITLLLSVVFAFISSNGYFNDIILKLSNISKGEEQIVGTLLRYSRYGTTTGSNWKGLIASLIPYVLLTLITIPNKTIDDKKYVYYHNILFMTTILYAFASSVDYAFRLVYSLYIIQLLLIPCAYNFGSKLQKQCVSIYLFLCICYYVLYIYTMYSSQIIGSIAPYHFFFVQ